MSGASRRYLTGLFLLLAAGALIGWIYGFPERGVLVAALIALAWQARQTLAFINALRSGDFSTFQQGDGVWQQIFSSFSYHQQRTARYKAQYRDLLQEIRRSTNAMPDGAVILDADHEIIICNRAAKSLAGLKPRKDRGHRVDNILRDPALTRLLNDEDSDAAVEIPSPVSEGGRLNCRVVPYGPDQKLLLLRDVTEQSRLARTRRDFVANASHELRSPLTVVSGYLDSLADDEDIPAVWVQPVAQMQIQARRMNRIVAELLELSRLEAGGPADDSQLVDIGALMAGARRALYQAGASAEIEIEHASKARLRGSINEIDSLITNLLSNAVRHTPAEGNIRLSWRTDPGGAELSVEDTGEGIDEEHLPRLTERFFRVDRGRSRDDGGVGLGLAIVKHVLGRHDGSLAIESERGKGSRFVCHFPVSRIVVDAS